MMEELIKDVESLVDDEYRRAAAEHGPAARSPHEAYALIKEEIEEADEEMESLHQRLEHIWTGVKADETRFYPDYLRSIKKAAVLGACELIQVAAMADKALVGHENTKEEI